MSEMKSTNYTKITWKFSSMQQTRTQKGKDRAGARNKKFLHKNEDWDSDSPNPHKSCKDREAR